MPSLLRAKNVVDVKDIVAILIIVAIVLHSLARLGQDTTGVARRLVLEAWVANSVGSGEVDGEGLEGLSRQVSSLGSKRVKRWVATVYLR